MSPATNPDILVEHLGLGETIQMFTSLSELSCCTSVTRVSKVDIARSQCIRVHEFGPEATSARKGRDSQVFFGPAARPIPKSGVYVLFSITGGISERLKMFNPTTAQHREYVLVCPIKIHSSVNDIISKIMVTQSVESCERRFT